MLGAPKSLKILQALWELGRPATIGEVKDLLLEEDPDRDYRTVGTLLGKLETAGRVTSELRHAEYKGKSPDSRPRVGRTKRFYVPAVTELEIAGEIFDDVLETVVCQNRELCELLVTKSQKRLEELSSGGSTSQGRRVPARQELP